MSTLGHSAQSSFDPDGSGPSDCIGYPSLKELFSANGGSNGSVRGQFVLVGGGCAVFLHQVEFQWELSIPLLCFMKLMDFTIVY